MYPCVLSIGFAGNLELAFIKIFLRRENKNKPDKTPTILKCVYSSSPYFQILLHTYHKDIIERTEV